MKLGKGINYSRYCLWWEGSEAADRTDYMLPSAQNINRGKISPAKLAETADHIRLIKNLGFDTVRLPVCFNVWASQNATDLSLSQYWVVVDNMISLCQSNGLKLIIDYHHAPLSDADFVKNKARIKNLWQQIAERLKNTDPNMVLFEIYNEPNQDISTDNLVIFYHEIVTTIRNTGGLNSGRKLVVGGTSFYDIGFGDSGLLPLLARNTFPNDPSIIYTIHFYQPTLFTWQGLNDGDANMPLINVEFPAIKDYTGKLPNNPNEFFANNYFHSSDPDIEALNINGKGMGSNEFIAACIRQLKVFTDAGIHIWCGEIGVYRKFMDNHSLENYLTVLLNNLKNNNIDWCWWDFEAGFSIFNPVPVAQVGNPDLQNVFGFAAPFLNEKVNPQMRRLLGLNERVKMNIITVTRNVRTKHDTFRIKIECLDHISNFKEFELNYQVSVKIGANFGLKSKKKILAPQKSITVSITGLDLTLLNLRINYLDGRFRLILNE